MLGYKTPEIEADFKAPQDKTDPRVVMGILILDRYFPEISWILTCGREGKHKEGSAHYWLPLSAFDIRRNQRIDEKYTEIINFLYLWFGDLFDFVREPDHYHLEIDKPFWKVIK